RGPGVVQHRVVGLRGGLERDLGRRERLIHPHPRQDWLRVLYHVDLHAYVPVVLRHGLVALDDVAGHVGFAPLPRRGLVRHGPAVRTQDPVADRVLRGGRAGFVVVVDDVVPAVLVAPVHGAVLPVVQDVVDEGEVPVHTDAGVAAGVARPQVVVERAVVPAGGAPAGVVVGVLRLRR